MVKIKEVWLVTEQKEVDFLEADNLISEDTTKDGRKIIKENILEALKEDKEVIPWIEIETLEDEELVIKAAKVGAKSIILSGKDCSQAPVIALENIVAETQKLKTEIFAFADSFEQMLSVSKSLDIGLNIVVKDTKLITVFKDYFTPIEFDLKSVKIKSIKSIGAGWRSCIDTCDIMKESEGMLVGSASNAYFLVHAETMKGEFTPPRVFRVNAGGIYNYVITDFKKGELKTKYLKELECGSKVLVVDKDGNTRRVIVGRNKIEHRPLSLLTTETGEKILLQEAETIYLTMSDGKPKSILLLEPGDEILMYFAMGGMHRGIKIEEGLIEY